MIHKFSHKNNEERQAAVDAGEKGRHIKSRLLTTSGRKKKQDLYVDAPSTKMNKAKGTKISIGASGAKNQEIGGGRKRRRKM